MRKFLEKNPLFSYFAGAITTLTFRQTAVAFSGTMANGILGAAFYILSARFLGPGVFGLLSVSIAVLSLTADIGNFGINTGLVKFVSKYANLDINKANQFLKLGLKIKLFVSFSLILMGFIFAPVISSFVFNKPELTLPLRLSFIGVGTALLFSFTTSLLQSFQKFTAWSLIQIATNFLRLVAVIALFLIGALNINNTIIVYILMPFLGFLISFSFMPLGFIKVKNECSVKSEFFNYNKWVATFSIIAAVSSRLDTFMSARLISSYDLGLYSAANQLVQVVPQIAAALGAVIAPKMASFTNISAFLSYLKKIQIMVTLISLAGLLTIPVIKVFIPILFGREYLGSFNLFIFLLLAMLVFLISVPIHNAVLYYYGYPKLFFFLALGHLSLIFILGWNLIPLYGALGAAYSVFIAHTFDFVVPAVWVLRNIRNQNKFK